MNSPESSPRKINVLFNQYSQVNQNPINRALQWVCIPLLVFSIIGLVTAIPFPHLNFLGKYNTYISWFSFLLAFTIYYYLKLSPILSYLMLLTVGILYYFIIQLEYVEREGGPDLWLVSGSIFVLAVLGLLWGRQIESQKICLLRYLKLLLIAPIWFLSLILKCFKMNY